MFKKYIITVALTAGIILGLVAAFNAIVDPFAMNLFINVQGFNDFKPSLNDRVRLLKAYELRRVKPDSIILGNSRVHLGFNTLNPGWVQQSRNRYNLGFDSASTKEMYYYLLHADSVHPLKSVLLGLDLFHLNNDPAITTPDFDTGILMSNGGIFSQIKMILADLRILTSLDTLKSSFETLRSQKSKYNIHWFASDGHRIAALFFARPGSDLKKFGPRYYFDAYDRSEAQENVIKKIPGPSRKRAYHEKSPEEKDPLTTFDYVRKIIGFCRDHDIKLTIFFTPSHAHKLEIEILDRGWSKIETSLRTMVKILAADARAHPDQSSIPLYDFSSYSSITTEPLPPENNKTGMQFFWDCSHFKENVGDLILDQIFQVKNPQIPVPKDFGELLTENNVGAIIARMHIGHDLYQKEHFREIGKIQSWAGGFNNKGSIIDKENNE